MSASTSRRGRFQFSIENVYSVRTSTPSATQPLTASRTDSRPARWPIRRGTPRAFAQRPLPSMMMATCLGRLPRRINSSGVKARAGNQLSLLPQGAASARSCGTTRNREAGRAARPRASDFHDFRGLLLEEFVHQRDVAIGELLHVRGQALRLVLGDIAVALLGLHVLEHVVAHLADV